MSIVDEQNPIAFIVPTVLLPNYMSNSLIPCKPTSKNTMVEFKREVSIDGIRKFKI